MAATPMPKSLQRNRRGAGVPESACDLFAIVRIRPHRPSSVKQAAAMSRSVFHS
jgi:hypothetical protein